MEQESNHNEAIRNNASNTFWRAATKLLLIFLVGLSGLIGLATGAWYVKTHCWFGFLGSGPIGIFDRYYQIEGDDTIYHVQQPGRIRPIQNKNIIFGIELSLKDECFCTDLYGEVHNYASGIKVRGGGILEPVNNDISQLKGPWFRPPPGETYQTEIMLKCRSQPDVSLAVFDFATFGLMESTQ